MNTSQFIVMCFMTVFLVFFTFILFKTSLASMPSYTKIAIAVTIVYTWLLIIVTSDVYIKLHGFKNEITAYRNDLNSELIQSYNEHRQSLKAEKSQ